MATSHYTITAQLAYHLPSTVPVVPLNEPLRYAHLPPVDAATVRCPALYVELVRRPLRPGSARAWLRSCPWAPSTRRDQGHPIAAYKIMLLAEPLTPVAAPRP